MPQPAVAMIQPAPAGGSPAAPVQHQAPSTGDADPFARALRDALDPPAGTAPADSAVELAAPWLLTLVPLLQPAVALAGQEASAVATVPGEQEATTAPAPAAAPLPLAIPADLLPGPPGPAGGRTGHPSAAATLLPAAPWDDAEGAAAGGPEPAGGAARAAAAAALGRAATRPAGLQPAAAGEAPAASAAATEMAGPPGVRPATTAPGDPAIGWPGSTGVAPGMAAAPDPAPALPPQRTGAEPGLLLDQVARAIHHVAYRSGGGRHEARLQLWPRELGELSVRLVMESGQLTADIAVARPEVKAMLESSLADLRQRLEQQGVDVEAFRVSVGAGFGGQPENRRELPGWPDRRCPLRIANVGPAPAAGPPAALPARRWPVAWGQAGLRLDSRA